MEKMDLENVNEEEQSSTSMSRERQVEEDNKEDKMLDSDIEEDINEVADTSSDDEDANEKEIKALETALTRNPYDYTSHLSLIGLLQKMGELERLRIARENMSAKYPLSPDIWLSWIGDEMKLATTSEQKAEVVKLCERAVEDYLSVEVWLEYLQFSIGNMGIQKDSVDYVRQLFERALTATGLHVTKGAIIWEAFREFEMILLTTIDSSKETERKEGIDRIGNLFRRQLACPLLNMEKTYKEYENWCKEEGLTCSVDPEIVKGGYERSCSKLNVRLPFEERLLSGQSELLDCYNSYLNYEKQNGDPGRITVLYERAITDLSLESTLWLDYISYVQTNIKIETFLEKVYQRAVRNVPWCAKIWQKWIISYEKWKKPLLEVQTLLENALAAGFQSAEEYRNLWLTYLEYLRRRIDPLSNEEERNIEILRNAFNKACEHLAKYFGMEGDPNCVILQYWARTEAIHANDMEKVRSLWTDILSQGHSSSAASWLEYISLERCYGDTKHLRKLYHKALSSVKDWPESIANAWINFERDEGTIEQMEFCETKVQEKLGKIAEERWKSQHESSASSSQSKRATKRKVDDGSKAKHFNCSPQKITKVERTKWKERALSIEKDEEKLVTKVLPPPGFKNDVYVEKMEEECEQQFNYDTSVFVSNLCYTTTEDEVRKALMPAGRITLFRMVKDYKGRSKGFCYVQFINKEAVEEALKLDRTLIDGRPMFVSRCNPDRTLRSSVFKYSSSLEKNKLFVKGLPVTTTKEQLENIFRVYGALKDVRIVTYRNGHSKGLAYVDFDDESHASKALLATDGMKIENKIIKVAISKPPERKKDVDDDSTSFIKSLGGSSMSRTVFGVPKTVLSMVPRTVKPNITNNGTSDSEKKRSMTNQDFRKMLLEKK